MRKLFYSIFAMLTLSLPGLNVFAEPEGGAVTIGRVEAIEYIIMIGCAIFVIGMIFIILSLRDSKKKALKQLPPDEYYEDECDESETYEQDICDEESYDDGESADSEAAADEPETENKLTEEEEILEEETQGEEEISETVEETKTEETVEETEPEVISESEPEKPKVRITLTGINNPDVKIMEFTDKITLGRRVGNDIMISDAAVSGKHCEVSFENGLVYVTDLESTNGTYLNEEPVVRAELNSGDMLIVGKCRYRINITK